MAKILIVEDDVSLANALSDWLTHEKFTVEMSHNGADALHRLKFFQYDAIVLDWNLPDMTGIDICQRYRLDGGRSPILMLTAKSAVHEKTTGLDAGSDDYLTKPFDNLELSARLRAIMRRQGELAPMVLKVGDLALELTAHKAVIKDSELKLTPKELAILELFMRHPEHVFSAEAILNRIWSSESTSTEHTVRNFVYTLRKQLQASGCDYVKTVHGFGYKLSLKDDGS